MNDQPQKNKRGDDRRGAPPRRTADRTAEADQTRREHAHLWTLRALTVVMCGLAAVVGYGTLHTLPELRAVQDAQVCAYRSVANREAHLAEQGPPAARRAHRQSSETFATLALVSARGRGVRCRPLLDQRNP